MKEELGEELDGTIEKLKSQLMSMNQDPEAVSGM